MRLLDLFCGAGGAAMGYHRAGFDEIVGVDIKPQKHYPFTFVLGDALEYCRLHGAEFDAIHASPPCQRYTRAQNAAKNAMAHPDLVGVTREALRATGKPYVIENVVGAPLLNPVILCGAQLGCKVYRHRLFESNILLLVPEHRPHHDHSKWKTGHGPTDNGFVSVFGHGAGRGWQEAGVRYADYARMAMGIDWMTKAELAEAIPPAYTEYIGKQLKEALQ